MILEDGNNIKLLKNSFFAHLKKKFLKNLVEFPVKTLNSHTQKNHV